MPQPPEPASVVRAVAAGVSRLIAGQLTEPEQQAQLDHLANLYAEHTDVRRPFAPTATRLYVPAPNYADTSPTGPPSYRHWNASSLSGKSTRPRTPRSSSTNSATKVQ